MTVKTIYVVIRENLTGELRLCEMQDYDAEAGREFHEYTWSDGNYSCDCNRSILFARAVNETEDHDVECSDGRYTIMAIFQNGRQVYTEQIKNDD